LSVPLGPLDIIQIAKETYPNKIKGDGWSWWNKFKKRHQNRITMKYSNTVTPARKNLSILSEIEHWIKDYEKEIREFNFNENTILNADETLLVTKKGNVMDARRVIAKDQLNAHVMEKRQNTIGSLIPFVAASGKVIMTVYVLCAKTKNGPTTKVDLVPLGREYRTRSTWPRYVCWTDSGRVNRETWINILEKLKSEIQFQRLGTVLLTLDNLDAHVNGKNVAWALNNNIRVLPYPKNSSLFIQALDQNPFGEFKKRLIQHKRKITKRSIFQGTMEKNPILEAAIRAEEESLTIPVIKSGFRETGVWPFDKNVILKNAKENNGDEPKEPKESEIERDARRAVTSYIKENTSYNNTKVTNVKYKTTKNTVYRPEDIN
jgi:hypothetical protein